MFPKNTWYVAAWDHEVKRLNLMRRLLLGDAVVFYRKSEVRPWHWQIDVVTVTPSSRRDVLREITLNVHIMDFALHQTVAASEFPTKKTYQPLPTCAAIQLSRNITGSGFGWVIRN